MNIRRYILGTIAAALFVVPSAAQAVVMQTTYKGTVTPNSSGGRLFGIAERIGGLPFELSLVWDKDDPIASGQSGVLDGSDEGSISYVTKPISILLKIGAGSRTFDQITSSDSISELRRNRRGNFSTLTNLSLDIGFGSDFTCGLGVVVPGIYQPLFLGERYQISNATPANQGSIGCGLFQAMVGIEFGLDATSLTVAPLVSPVPVPPAIPLLLTGLAALFGVRRWRRG